MRGFESERVLYRYRSCGSGISGALYQYEMRKMLEACLIDPCRL
jgi:hypothetical protein